MPRCSTHQPEECTQLTDKKVWFITGAGRGMGVDIATAALAAGHAVVATARNPDTVTAAQGQDEDLLAVKLDVTDPADAQAAVQAAVERFGRIDVLVNNAGNFYAGFFEEITPQGLPGPGRDHPVRPHARHPRRPAGPARPALGPGGRDLLDRRHRRPGVLHRLCRGQVRGRGLDRVACPEVAPFGIRTMLVEPGFFRTQLLSPESTNYAKASIDDYAERTSQTVAAWKAMNGQQGGDPAKLANALVQLASRDEPPRRFVAGADAVATVEQKAKDLLAQADAYRELSSHLGHDDA
jgi:NAD(P)-dependent dehydrogenase (short-subunit alcohol dehydrogenase family)